MLPNIRLFYQVRNLLVFLETKKFCSTVGIEFTWKFADGGSIHARHIVAGHGWKILLD